MAYSTDTRKMVLSYLEKGHSYEEKRREFDEKMSKPVPQAFLLCAALSYFAVLTVTAVVLLISAKVKTPFAAIIPRSG